MRFAIGFLFVGLTFAQNPYLDQFGQSIKDAAQAGAAKRQLDLEQQQIRNQKEIADKEIELERERLALEQQSGQRPSTTAERVPLPPFRQFISSPAFNSYGLNKLTDDELEAFHGWLERALWIYGEMVHKETIHGLAVEGARAEEAKTATAH